MLISSLRSGQNGRHFAGNIQISLKLIPKGSIDNISALVQVMAWHWIGDKPAFEPMINQVSICPNP